MLAGRLPFEGDNAMAVMKGIESRDPVPLHELRADVPDDLVRVVNRALRKSRNDRVASVADLAQQLTTVRNTLTSRVAAPRPVARKRRSPRRRSVSWRWQQGSDGPSAGARPSALPESAFQRSRGWPIRTSYRGLSVAEEIEPLLADDPTLPASCGRVFLHVGHRPKPGGARVLTKTYVDKTDSWRDLGVAPIQGARVPLGMQRFKFVRDGKPDVEVAFPVGGPGAILLNRTLDEGGDGSDVAVLGGGVNSWITGIEPIERIQLPDFRINKYEVTNRQFKAFIQAGGYKTREFWDQHFSDGQSDIPWEKAIERFVDATGRPGPSTWELATIHPAATISP